MGTLVILIYTQGNSDLERLVGWLVQDHRAGEHERWFDSSCSDPRLRVVGLCAVQLHMASDPELPPSEDSVTDDHMLVEAQGAFQAGPVSLSF